MGRKKAEREADITGNGGARPGAGRPMIGEEPKVKRSVMLLPNDQKLFEKLGGGNLSAGIMEGAKRIRARAAKAGEK